MLRAHTVYFSDQSLCKGEWSVLLSIITFMVNAITQDGDDGHLSPVLAWVTRNTVPALPECPLPKALECSGKCVLQHKTEWGKTGGNTNFDRSIQIEAFFIDNKVFFKPEKKTSKNDEEKLQSKDW